MSNQIKVLAAKQAGKEAGKKAQAGAGAIGGFIRENNWSVRGLSFIGSLAMIVVSILKILNFFSVLTDFFDYVINAYSCLFAFALFMVEAKDDWVLVESSRKWIFSNFGFLRTNLGRGLFSIFIGGIWMTTSVIWVFWIGIYVIVIGFMYILTHLGGCCGKDRSADAAEAPGPILAPSPRNGSG